MKRVVALLSILVLFGCGAGHSPQIEPFDPLVEQHRAWQTLVEQADFALEQNRLDDALALYERSLAIQPEHAGVHLKLGQIYLRQEEYEKAAQAFEQSLKADPKQVEVWNHLGYVQEKLHRYQKAVEAFHRTLELAPENLYALNHMGLAYRQLGKLEEAEALLRTALSIDPGATRNENRNTHNYLALVYEDKGDIANAIAELRESIRLFPQDLWARNRLAALFENQGHLYEAQLAYAEILQIDPDNAQAAQRLQAIQDAAEQQVVDVSPVEIVHEDVQTILRETPTASDYPDADAVVLLNEFSHEVLPDGRSRYTTHKLLKLLTPRVEQYADVAVPFNARTQNIGVNFARTILPDGTELKPTNEAYSDVTPPDLLSYRLYTDTMWKVVTMPGVVPEAILEYMVTVEDAPGATAGREVWFWGGMQFQDEEPVLRNICALRVPAEMELAWRTYQIDLEPEVTQTDSERIYVWRTGAFEALPSEPAIADAAELAPRLSYASVQSWDRVAAWYHELAQDRYQPDDAIRDIAQRLTADAETQEEKMQRLYSFVADDIRYVGIELGQGAYQPTHAAEVLRHRYGDCKDKATLLISLYGLIGQPAYPALIQPRPYERVDPSLPSPSQFSHLIVAVPHAEGYLWLDPTAAYSRYGDLPYTDQGRQALVVHGETGELIETPVYPPESNRLNIRSRLEISEAGVISGRQHLTAYGEYNQHYRLTYQQIKPSEWANSTAAQMTRRYPGLRVTSVELNHADDLGEPVEVIIDFDHVPMNVLTDGSLVFAPSQLDLADYASLLTSPERQYPLDLGYPVVLEQTILLQLPPGWTVAAQPEDGHWESDIGTFERTVLLDANYLRWNSRFELRKSTVPPDTYPEAKRFLEKVIHEDRALIRLTREPS